MSDAIKNFPKQFAWEPVIENRKGLDPKTHRGFVVVGMGGSDLAAGILKTVKPELDMINHRDYGLPAISEKELARRLIILSSYSGNTEEVFDGLCLAHEMKLTPVVISTGGKLTEFAKRWNYPHVQLPDTGIQPRSALGFSLLAFLKVMGQNELLEQVMELAEILDSKKQEEGGKKLAEKLRNKIPVIYASEKNSSIAYIWKIKLNETGKIPAFWNVFPELNHNEMQGFDVAASTRPLSDKFFFVILKDAGDHPRIQRRMSAITKLYQDRGFRVEVLEISGKNAVHKIFTSLLVADWTAYYLGKGYGVEIEEVPMVEEFKKLIK